jgi:S-formylglutathione hydrolase FrmB
MTLYGPPEVVGKTDVPLVILLHGIYSSHWAWAFKGGAHLTLARLTASGAVPPMVLAMPSDGLWGDGSGYVPHPSQDFERWIVDEVPVAAAEVLPCLGSASPRFIAGLSMGGFGALRLAGKYPSRFQGASGHSSATHLEQLRGGVEEPLARYGAHPDDQSVLETLLRNRDSLPPFRFDCGTRDFLLAYNRELHLALQAAGVPHDYEEFPGAHDWAYWEAHLEDSLKFFARCLAGK